MARQNIEVILEKRVSKLREEEKSKKDELAEIQKELRRYETALESLKEGYSCAKEKRQGRKWNCQLETASSDLNVKYAGIL